VPKRLRAVELVNGSSADQAELITPPLKEDGEINLFNDLHVRELNITCFNAKVSGVPGLTVSANPNPAPATSGAKASANRYECARAGCPIK
jgi:hypothetical protein